MIYLEPVHFPAAHVVVYGSSKDKHGVSDNSTGMEQAARGHLGVLSQGDDGPWLYK